MSIKQQHVHRLAKFFARATYKGECLEYCSHKFSDYIQVKHNLDQYFNSNSTALHRYVYAVWNDQPLTQQDVIMHTCDNRICINPRHLKLGTILTNNADRVKKQRKQNKSI